MRPRARRRLRQIARALSLLTIVAALGLGLWVTRERSTAATLSDVITRPAPELDPTAQVLLPNLRGAVVVVPDRPHTPEELTAGQITRTRRFLVNTNALGLRGAEVKVPAPGPRVLAVGDSVTFGWGVEDGESWPARLAEALGAQVPGLEVLNAGVPAQRPAAIAAWTAANARGLDVDLVLLARRPDPREADPIAAYAAAVSRVRAALGDVPLGVILPPLSTFDPDGLARMEEERARLTEALAPVPVLDLTPAFRAATPDRGVILEVRGEEQVVLRLPERAELLRARRPARGLAPDVLARLEEDSTMVEPLFFDGGHPDAEGFRVFAEAVARWVSTTGLLRAAPSAPSTVGAAPLIPANAPEWQEDPPPFVNSPAFYGEASWDDVRGRVLQHQATVWRDLARLRAEAQDLDGAAAIYAEATGWLEAHPVRSGVGQALHALLLAAMRRDAALVSALATGAPLPLPEGGLARLRALKLRGEPAQTLSVEAEKLRFSPLDPAAFQDFADRHALRLALVEAALDALDPLALPDVWGPWDPGSRATTLAGLLGEDTSGEPATKARFTAKGLGALPTGDSWVDVAGEPGPAAIGRLEVLSLEDPAHHAWLSGEAKRLQLALDQDPGRVRAALQPTLLHLQAQPYTSRYYNIKQARNEAVRQLARAGAYAQAAALLDDAFPLHRQDFAAPNRAGILRGIQGRLLGHAQDPSAEAVMREALAHGDRFLASIDRAEGN